MRLVSKRTFYRLQKRGCHNITEDIKKGMPEIRQVQIGLMNINMLGFGCEVCPLVPYPEKKVMYSIYFRIDMEMMLNRLVPQGLNYKHSCEGPDDMPAHVKTALLGTSLSIPITDGQLNMGTWQGVWLCEHRDRASSRHLVCTVQGMPK